MLLLDTYILIDLLRWQTPALCGLESFPRLPLDQTIARDTVQIRQRHGLKVPDAIILATVTWHGLTLAARNSRDVPSAPRAPGPAPAPGGVEPHGGFGAAAPAVAS